MTRDWEEKDKGITSCPEVTSHSVPEYNSSPLITEQIILDWEPIHPGDKLISVFLGHPQLVFWEGPSWGEGEHSKAGLVHQDYVLTTVTVGFPALPKEPKDNPLLTAGLTKQALRRGAYPVLRFDDADSLFAFNSDPNRATVRRKYWIYLGYPLSSLLKFSSEGGFSVWQSDSILSLPELDLGVSADEFFRLLSHPETQAACGQLIRLHGADVPFFKKSNAGKVKAVIGARK